MEGILIPVFGALIGGTLGLICFFKPQLRQYFLSALITPIATSVAFLLGAFWLADMNPAREYGRAYIPNGKEHDPTRLDYILWLSAVIGTMVLCATVLHLVQRVTLNVLKGVIRKNDISDQSILGQGKSAEQSNDVD
jgi:hypothetical protein